MAAMASAFWLPISLKPAYAASAICRFPSQMALDCANANVCNAASYSKHSEDDLGALNGCFALSLPERGQPVYLNLRCCDENVATISNKPVLID